MKNSSNNLNWEISEKPIYNISGQIIEGYKEISKIENGNCNLLSIMKNSYHPLTVKEFSSIVETISINTNMELSGFQEFKEGKIITAQLKSNTPFIINGSNIEGYLTLGTGFDGSKSFFIGHTNEFLRCRNQFGRIIKDYTSRLTRNNKIRVETVLEQIIYYNRFEEQLYKSFEKMQKVKIAPGIIKECVERVIGLTNEERLDNRLITQGTHSKLTNLRDSILRESIELGENAFALFNGITYYSTHLMKTKEQDVFGNLLTSRATVNQRGYDFINELIA